MVLDIMKPLNALAERLKGKPVADQELAISEDSVFRKWNLFPYSPDKLIQRKRFDIFEEMSRDDQIAQCLSARKTLLLSSGWEIEPLDETPAAVEQADFIRWNFNDGIHGTFHDDLWELSGALEIGWSLSEKIYSVVDDGPWRGKWYLKMLKSKNFKDFNLARDEYDNLKPDGIVRITQPQTTQIFPSHKFVLYSYRKRYEDLFGTSVLRSLYDLWWIKHVLKRAMGVAFERAGVPPIIGKYPRGMSELEQNALFSLIKSMRFESAVVIPKEVELVMSDPTNRTGEALIEAIRHIDTQIVKTILGQTLTQSQGDRGSQALGNIHKDILIMYVEELARDIEVKVVRNQIIKDLIDFNFPNPLYPNFTFKPIAPEDEKGRVDAFLNALSKGAVMATIEDENEIRRILGFGKRDLSLDTLPKPILPQFGGDPNAPTSSVNSAPASAPAKTTKPGEGPIPDPDKAPMPQEKPDGQFPPKASAAKLQERIFTGVRRRTFTKVEERVDFAEVLNTIEVTGVEDIMADVAPMLVEAQNDILAQVQRRKIIENQDSKAIDGIAIKNLADIKSALKDGLVRVARRGRKSANAELSQARREIKMAEPTDISRFLPAEVEKLFAARAFYITGVIRDNILGLAKNSLFSSIKNGVDLRTAMAGLKGVMEPYVSSGIVDPATAGGPRLETIVRTNVVDAFNMSRLETFKANGDFVVGLEYSAILDDRVRENHAAMDGKQYATDDAIWDRWTPPNGYNCRCVLVPVTLADGDFKPDKKPPTSVQPDAGFKENAV